MKYTTVNQPFRLASIGHIIEQAQRNQQSFWASDLIAKGLTPDEIRVAIQRAMTTCKRSGMDVDMHFQLKHLASEQCAAFDDCKLSDFGYLLTVINANPDNEYVALQQKQLLERDIWSMVTPELR